MCCWWPFWLLAPRYSLGLFWTLWIFACILGYFWGLIICHTVLLYTLLTLPTLILLIPKDLWNNKFIMKKMTLGLFCVQRVQYRMWTSRSSFRWFLGWFFVLSSLPPQLSWVSYYRLQPRDLIYFFITDETRAFRNASASPWWGCF